ncbi:MULTISPECIES: PTS IIA-like nitrogen regulatory protein PtsN [Gammaproteobacteria]|uniref:PTS IIA-like nitrogen regulatory protein PtsN n=1 Tax=Gammaproteobacteria TaxID=1236 RepID=UPI000DD0D8F0|nr:MULTISPECIES: PTS IIA-like nitrogen regulatory protein PtsN [Gammaproteobacteria]RTE86354.1 PTS IIA-like nitrogen-regulatory protein PtsN [Aliidiomarina sp. B3213]TCZ91704.1 PTS IIA-like nitrogen-regulatory protein PtsN [Lysobacter sp. N42]
MDLREILTPDCTKCAVPELSKKKVLETISQMVAPKLGGVSRDDVFESLLQRERLGSTGIGLGIAIPHGRLSNASHPVAVLITLDAPIEFEAIDNQPVDIIFALLVPENEPEKHLQTLSVVAQRLNSRECCRKLRAASEDLDLYNLFTDDKEKCN